MQIDEALELLKHHSLTHEDTEHEKSVRGFLGMLRPYKGYLNKENYLELLAVIKVLGACMHADHVPREVIAQLWGICHFARTWGIDEEGMLRRNHLLSEEQVTLLRNWVEHISSEVLALLERDAGGHDPD